MNIARRVVTDPRTLLPLLLEVGIIAYYLLIRPDAPGGQFVAGLALGLMFLVVVLGVDRARMAQDARDRIDRITDLTRS